MDGNQPRIALASDLDKDDWALRVFYQDGDAHKTSETKGATIAEGYRKADVAGEGSPPALLTRADREWFIKRLIEARAKWQTQLNGDPLPLVLP